MCDDLTPRPENLPDEDYMFHDGEWWVRSTAIRALIEGEPA